MPIALDVRERLMGSWETARGALIEQLTLWVASLNASASSAFSDYATGAWTPSLRGATDGVCSLTSARGVYVQLGRLVFVQFDLSGTGATALSGDWVIGGLPFTVTNDASVTLYEGSGVLAAYNDFPTSATSTGIVPVAVKNTTTLKFLFVYGGAAATASAPVSGGTPSATLACTGHVIYLK